MKTNFTVLLLGAVCCLCGKKFITQKYKVHKENKNISDENFIDNNSDFFTDRRIRQQVE
ncbi:MAG: hypothetical protein LBR86_00145 [Tannerella sp.]|nr:hypothetical protein [Tannerella sp.]